MYAGIPARFCPSCDAIPEALQGRAFFYISNFMLSITTKMAIRCETCILHRTKGTSSRAKGAASHEGQNLACGGPWVYNK